MCPPAGGAIGRFRASLHSVVDHGFRAFLDGMGCLLGRFHHLFIARTRGGYGRFGKRNDIFRTSRQASRRLVDQSGHALRHLRYLLVRGPRNFATGIRRDAGHVMAIGGGLGRRCLRQRGEDRLQVRWRVRRQELAGEG